MSIASRKLIWDRLKVSILLLLCVSMLMSIGTIAIRNMFLDQEHKSYTLLVENYAEQEEERIDFYESLVRLSVGYIAQMHAEGRPADEISNNLFAFLVGYDNIFQDISVQTYGLIDGVLASNAQEYDPRAHQQYDPREDPWYKEAIAADGEIITLPLYSDYLTGNQCVTIAQKVPGTDDVLAFDLFYSTQVNTNEDGVLPPGCSYYLCDAEGTILTMDTSLHVSKERAQQILTSLLEQTPNGHSMFFLEDFETGGSSHRNAYIEHLDNGWYVVLTVPQEVIVSELMPVYIGIAVFTAIWIIAIVLFGIHEYRRERGREKLINEREFLIRDRKIIEKTTESTLLAYKILIYIDITNDRMQVVYSNDKSNLISSFYSVYIKQIAPFCEMDSDNISFIDIFGHEQLKESLKDHDYIEASIKFGRTEETRVPYVITVAVIERQEDGTPVSAAMSVRNIENIMREERHQRALLQTAAEQAESASNAKSAFLSSMSHDMRTPLNAIQGMTALALMNIDDKAIVKRNLQTIDASSRHLLSLINSVLDMSKIESGHLALNESPMRISDLMKQVTTMFTASAQESGLIFEVHEDKITHDLVEGDFGRLAELLFNIVSNAIKFTPKDGKVTVSAIEKDKLVSGMQCYTFRISDTGIGMSKEFIKHIFEPFARANDSVVSEIEGTGLGMPIALNIARLMGGDIEIDSELGKGSCFEITVFLRVIEEDAHIVADSAPVDLIAATGSTDDSTIEPACDLSPGSSHDSYDSSKVPDNSNITIDQFQKCDFSGKRALLVDDVEINNLIAQELLATVHIDSDIVSDGSEAVDVLLKTEPGYYDIVFMDIQMPVMDGYQAARKIRELGSDSNINRPDLTTLPVIAMTANAFVEDIRKAKDAGMDSHISKPIDLNVLKSLLVEKLDQ